MTPLIFNVILHVVNVILIVVLGCLISSQYMIELSNQIRVCRSILLHFFFLNWLKKDYVIIYLKWSSITSWKSLVTMGTLTFSKRFSNFHIFQVRQKGRYHLPLIFISHSCWFNKISRQLEFIELLDSLFTHGIMLSHVLV